MQVSGFMLKEGVKRHELAAETLRKQWKDSLFTFEGEGKELPTTIMERIHDEELIIATLQTCQARFNLAVKVTITDGKKAREMTLAQAVKLVGSAGELEKMWRNYAGDSGKDPYMHRAGERNKDTEYARRAVSTAVALEAALEAAKYAASLRAAIAEGNSTKMDSEAIGLNPQML